MKRALLVVAVIIILSGCGTTETMTCTGDNTVGNVTSKTTYKIEHKNNEIKKLTVIYEYNDKHTDETKNGTDETTNDNHTDGVGTGTDGTTNDTDNDEDGIIDGVVGDALDDVVTGVTDGILDIAGIKNQHSNKFGSYTNIEGFTTTTDVDNNNNYKITYTYDLSKLSDNDLTTFNIDKNLETQKKVYTDRGLTCK